MKKIMLALLYILYHTNITERLGVGAGKEVLVKYN